MTGGLRGRRWRALGALTLALACLGSAAAFVGGSHAASAAPAGRAIPNVTVATACPTLHAVYPGDSRGSTFYGLPVAVSLSGGTFDVGVAAHTTGITATVCSFFVLPAIAARTSVSSVNAPGSPNDCPGCSISFGTGATVDVYGTVALPATLSPAGPITASIAPQPAPNGGLNLIVTAPVMAAVSVPEAGVSCTLGPVMATLTTGTSGSLTGQPITGSLNNASAAGVSSTFTVPAATPSTDCPADLIPSLNTLTGLPALPGSATFSAPFTFATSLT